MFELQGGMILCLYPRSELAKDAKVSFAPAKAGEFSVGHAVSSKAEVDAVLAQAEAAEAAGATLTDRPHDRPWGIYSGYFQISTGTCGRCSGIHGSRAHMSSEARGRCRVRRHVGPSDGDAMDVTRQANCLRRSI